MWLDGLLSDLWNKQHHHGRAKIMLPLFDKKTHRYADKDTHGFFHNSQQQACSNNYRKSIWTPVFVLMNIRAQTHTHQFVPVGLYVWGSVSGVGNSIQIFRPLCVPLQLWPETLETSGLHTHAHTQAQTTTAQWHSKDIAAEQLRIIASELRTSRRTTYKNHTVLHINAFLIPEWSRLRKAKF